MKLKDGYILAKIKKGKIHIFKEGNKQTTYLCSIGTCQKDGIIFPKNTKTDSLCKNCLKKYSSLMKRK